MLNVGQPRFNVSQLCNVDASAGWTITTELLFKSSDSPFLGTVGHLYVPSDFCGAFANPSSPGSLGTIGHNNDLISSGCSASACLSLPPQVMKVILAFLSPKF